MNKIFAPFLPPWVETGLQPAFYDMESGTVLQQTARMYAKVQQLTRLFNELSEETKTEVENFEQTVNDTVQEYIGKFTELKDFVDDYFDNLDVQEEINNKLDEMAEDGTLQEIITTYIQSNVAWTFDNVAGMQSATNLVAGSFARTLGYYSKSDQGGGLYKIIAHDTETIDGGRYIEISDTLTAELIIENGAVNVKQYGAKGDGVTDDTTAIQAALDSGFDVNVASGTYLVSDTLVMPFDIKLIGDSKVNTIIKSTINNDYTLKYGSSYEYGTYKGVIKNIKITSENAVADKPKGVMLYSGCTIDTCEFAYIGQAINRDSHYIDLIRIQDTAFLYCVPNNNYIINLAGNSDGLILNHLKFESYTDDSTAYNGIFIQTSHGCNISDSILNCNVSLDRCNATNLNNIHTELTNKSYYIKDSNVSFSNIFKFKNETNTDFVLATTDYAKSNVIELNNILFTRNASNINLVATDEINEMPINTIINMKDCYRHFNLADGGEFANIIQGIHITNNAEFNTLSGKYSKSSTVTNAGVDSDYQVTSATASSLANIGKNTRIKWLADDVVTRHYRAVVICDETRKIIAGYSSDTSVNSLVRNGDGVAIAINNDKYNKDIYLYAGDTLDAYTQMAKLPNVCRTRLYDNGQQINTIAWSTVASTNGRTGYNNVQRYIKDGANVIVYSSATPSTGTWTKYDKVINTNHNSSQPISWEYDGENWIAQGSY